MSSPVNGGDSVAPIYRRLPHGPHGKSRQEVRRNQRARMLGSMIEALAACGYEQTTVKQVVGMAAVSRRSFYEMFSSKEDCFLAAFDAIAAQYVARLREAYRLSRGGSTERLHAVLAELLSLASADPKQACLVTRDCFAAGESGVGRLHKLQSSCEQALAAHLTEPAGQLLPVPLLKGVIGGLHLLISDALRERRLEQIASEELVRWTMLCAEPDPRELRSADRCTTDLKEDPPFGEQVTKEIEGAEDERTRMLFSALYLVKTNGHSELNAIQIAEFAGLSMDQFFPHFASASDCYEEALGMLADELLGVLYDTTSETREWPAVVRSSLAALTAHIAQHPVHAHALNLALGSTQSSTVDRGVSVARQIASLLTERAPAQISESYRIELIAGAIGHTINSYVERRASNLLPALVDYLSYLVIAPHLGSQEALRAIAELRSQDTLIAVPVG
jgi:AcrR family transcriptional regulator